MNKIVIVILAAVVGMAACKKDQPASFHGTENIYFDLDPAQERDSILYTFAYHPERAKDTVWVPVSISGTRASIDRSYAAKVLDSGTTAKVNVHYEPLKDKYVFGATFGTIYMPVILYNQDTLMLKQSYSLMIQLVPTSDFDTDFSKLITARIVFSNKLEKPKWWDMWLGGYYSQVKHQLFRLSATTDDLSTNGIDAPKNLYYVDKLKALLASPATWIANNPGKGYVLTARPDGNFDFYNAGTPSIKFLYQKDPGTGKYYFIDENGKQVI
jgi:hypothetical protein